MLGLLWALLTRTRWGTLVRAATQDREMVGALGVNQAMLFTGTLFLGAALARDSNGWLVALLPSEWALKTFSDKNEDWIISEQPFPPPAVVK